MSFQSVKKHLFSEVHFYLYFNIFFTQTEPNRTIGSILFLPENATNTLFSQLMSCWTTGTQSLYKLGKHIKIHIISRHSLFVKEMFDERHHLLRFARPEITKSVKFVKFNQSLALGLEVCF